MKCHTCNGATTVRNSRPILDGMCTWRRRQCRSCGLVFTTRETGSTENLFVQKRNGQRKRFVYEKLFASIFTQLNTRKQRDNGSDALAAKRLTASVIDRLRPRFVRNDTVTTRNLVLLTHAELMKFDPSVAASYIHYSDFRLQVAFRTRR